MKKIFWLLIIFTAAGCNKKSSAKKTVAIDSTVINAPDSVYVSENKQFLDLFPDNSFDTLAIVSPENPDQPLRNAKRISSNDAMLFPKFYKIGNAVRPEVFALSKFNINKDNYGLIVQSPGDLSLSSLNLLVYNKIADAITATMEIADRTRDAGYQSEKKSWFVRDSAGLRGILQFSTSVGPVDADDPTLPNKTNDLYWIRFKNVGIDTVKISKKEMPQASRIMKYHTK